jgi:hypothetical protein
LPGVTASHVAIRSFALSDFFEPPPESPGPEPQRYRTPPGFGAPSGTLPGVVAVERILAQTDDVAVCVTRLAGYPTGFEFDVVTMGAAGQDDVDPLMFHHHQRGRRGAADGIPLQRTGAARRRRQHRHALRPAGRLAARARRDIRQGGRA